VEVAAMVSVELINNPRLRCVGCVKPGDGAATSAGSTVQPFEEQTTQRPVFSLFLEEHRGEQDRLVVVVDSGERGGRWWR